MKPLLLDLCCKAGGASKGYVEAGFDVVGVDLESRPLKTRLASTPLGFRSFLLCAAPSGYGKRATDESFNRLRI